MAAAGRAARSARSSATAAITIIAGPCSVESREQMQRGRRGLRRARHPRPARRRVQAAHVAVLVPGARGGGPQAARARRASEYGLLVVHRGHRLRARRDRRRLRRHPADRHAQHGELQPAQEDRRGHRRQRQAGRCSSAAWPRRSRSGCRRATTSRCTATRTSSCASAASARSRRRRASRSTSRRCRSCKKLSLLPIIVDVSHPAGQRDLVPAVSRAAVAVGADGIMVEVHPEPAQGAVRRAAVARPGRTAGARRRT